MLGFQKGPSCGPRRPVLDGKAGSAGHLFYNFVKFQDSAFL
jgi:hypothetical protein